MEVLRNGKFSQVITQLNLGLSKTNADIRNSNFLTSSLGMVIKDGVMQTVEDIDQLDTSNIGGSFPYPQVFTLTNLIIGCNETEIYEYENETWTLKYTATAGSTWEVLDFHDYIILSNGRQTVVRDAESKEYSMSTTIPTGMALCNFNGQLLIGSPDAGYI